VWLLEREDRRSAVPAPLSLSRSLDLSLSRSLALSLSLSPLVVLHVSRSLALLLSCSLLLSRSLARSLAFSPLVGVHVSSSLPWWGCTKGVGVSAATDFDSTQPRKNVEWDCTEFLTKRRRWGERAGLWRPATVLEGLTTAQGKPYMSAVPGCACRFTEKKSTPAHACSRMNVLPVWEPPPCSGQRQAW
jgi:hypothetical protein